MGRGPAQPITFSKFHGPARPIIFSEVSARPDNYVGRPVYLTGRPMCCPVLKGACAYADVIFLRPVVFSFFFRLDSVGQLFSAHKTHITSTHYSYNSAPPTTRSDGFLWTTTSSCCCKARSSSNSSSTWCCNTRWCYNTRCYNTLYRSKITPVHAVIFWRPLSALRQQQSSSPVRH